MTPKFKFYDVTVSIEAENEKGQIKRTTTKLLVDASDTNMAEKNTMKLMEGTMYDWEILSISQSRTKEVYIIED